jgi:hypothetical protein
VLLPILPQIVAPHLLHWILGFVLDPLVLLLGFLTPLNSNLFSIFAKTLLHMILTYKCFELWNAQIAFSHYIVSFLHTLKMTMNVTMISLPLQEKGQYVTNAFTTNCNYLVFATNFFPSVINVTSC